MRKITSEIKVTERVDLKNSYDGEALCRHAEIQSEDYLILGNMIAEKSGMQLGDADKNVFAYKSTTEEQQHIVLSIIESCETSPRADISAKFERKDCMAHNDINAVYNSMVKLVDCATSSLKELGKLYEQ